jgi:hypothetical protein
MNMAGSAVDRRLLVSMRRWELFCVPPAEKLEPRLYMGATSHLFSQG